MACDPTKLMISYVMNEREKIHLTFINNDRQVATYMLDVTVDGSRPILKINIDIISQVEPTNSAPSPPLHLEIDDDDSAEYESLDAHSMNMNYYPMNMKDHPTDAEDLKNFPKKCEECGSKSHPNHSFYNKLISTKNKYSVARKSWKCYWIKYWWESLLIFLCWRVVVNTLRWNMYVLFVPECFCLESMNARATFASTSTLAITVAMLNMSLKDTGMSQF